MPKFIKYQPKKWILDDPNPPYIMIEQFDENIYKLAVYADKEYATLSHRPTMKSYASLEDAENAAMGLWSSITANEYDPKENKASSILIRVTGSLKAKLQKMADLNTGGNLTQFILSRCMTANKVLTFTTVIGALADIPDAFKQFEEKAREQGEIISVSENINNIESLSVSSPAPLGYHARWIFVIIPNHP